MGKYLELKKRHQKEVNAFPLFFAFTNEQFNKCMEDLGLSPEDTDKIYKFGNTGGYYRKTDATALHELLDRHDRGLNEAMKDSEFVFEMFKYELANHEYSYTGDITDTLDALGLTEKDIKENPLLREALDKAIASID